MAALTAAGFIPFGFYAAQYDAGPPNKQPLFDAALGRLGAPAWLLSRDQQTVRQRFTTYSASILSFVGAIHFGAALAAPHAVSLLWSVVPSLAGWAALNTDSRTSLQILGASFAAAWTFDAAATQAGKVPRRELCGRSPSSWLILPTTNCPQCAPPQALYPSGS